MTKLRSALCILLCLAMILVFTTACSGGSGYRIIDEYSGKGSYYIAFRQGDHLRDYISAAMQELAASGALRTASVTWFGENLVSVKGQEGAMDELWENKPDRTLIVGIDPTNMPMSYPAGEGYQGFDVDMISYICGYLGWSMVLYPINIDDAEVELNSGNIDVAMAIPESSRSSNFDYSPAYLTSQYVLVTRNGSHIRRRSGLKGKTLGVAVSDVDVLQEDEKFVDSLGSITYQTNTDGLFLALMKGEVDGILVSSVVAAYHIK